MSIILDALLHSAINPALSLLPPRMDSDQARLGLLAITLQEADATARIQHGGGPAHGLWQFEEGGAVHGVLKHHATGGHARMVCLSCHVPTDEHSVWLALVAKDVLAAAFARLLLYTHPDPLPSVDDCQGWWDYYEGLWRPGKPRREKWDGCHALARAQIMT